MPQYQSQPKPMNRPADTLVQKSEQYVGAMALISRTQVKLWKAMLVSLFMTGFVGAIVFVYGFQLGNPSNASPSPKINLALLSTIISSSYASQDEGWDKAFDGDLDSASAMVWNSQGSESPYVAIKLPGSGAQISELSLSIDPSNPRYQTCGVKEFELLGSLDGNTFTSLFSGMKTNSVGEQRFTISSFNEVQFVKLLLKSNWGDPNYSCVKEIGLIK